MKLQSYAIVLLLSLLVLSSCDSNEPQSYRVDTISIPATSGTILPSDGSTFEEGTSVVFSADPIERWIFVRWEGDISGSNNPDTIVISSDMTVAAVFERQVFSVDIATQGGGIVMQSVDGEPGRGDYLAGTKVDIEAFPDDGWIFDRWEGDLLGDDNPERLTIETDVSVSAIFLPDISRSEILAFYSFDGNADDISGNNNNGTIEDVNTAADRFGQLSKAFDFDGENDRIVVPHSVSLDVGASNTSYSVSLWARSDFSTSSRLLDKWDDFIGTPYPFSVRAEPDTMNIHGAIYDGSTVNRIDLGGAWDGQWHHFVMTVDLAQQVFAVYFDGSLVSSESVTFSGPTRNSSPMYIGNSRAYQTNRYFRGQIDEILIFDRAFTPEEVAFLNGIGGWLQ
ncbi:MAG: LamG domain-containing protein [Rhodothermales bacterium]|nr:LamG domain-containing protein [Rhodothermales bacterium]